MVELLKLGALSLLLSTLLTAVTLLPILVSCGLNFKSLADHRNEPIGLIQIKAPLDCRPKSGACHFTQDRFPSSK